MNPGPLELLHEAVDRTRALTRSRPATGRTHDDADPVAGSLATDSAQRFDPFPLLRALDAAGARAVVIGQVAGILHGSTELTGDLDLLWDGAPEQADTLAHAFAAAGCTLLDDEQRPVPPRPQALLRPKVQFDSPQVSGDCCTPDLPWGTLPVRPLLDRALTAVDTDGLRVRYLRRDDLILMRRALGRPKDLRRAEELERL
ncbi:hypothetical protein AB0L65_55560 [Nonomuraea sp. NPDC052116]|uniref:hypothetical protein n=1 Tax=Nonomuraea sp. NPDC052116 TaxID=3155665 RepID=UPI00343BAE5E